MFAKNGVVARKKHLSEEILKMFAKVGVVQEASDTKNRCDM